MLIQHKKPLPKLRTSAILGTVIGLFLVTVCYGAQQIFSRKPEADQINPGQALFDPEVQTIAEKALEQAIAGHGGAYAFAIVSDPNSGRILAVANKDNRKRLHPNAHWALSLRSEPASVIKTITVASALEMGATEIDKPHNCENGKYTIDGKVFDDWKPFDYLTTSQTVVNSSDICSIKIALKLGARNLYQTLHNFGFGDGGSAESFPEARPGIVPELGQTSNAYYAATVGVGFSGLYTTPLEIVQAYGAIANGGNLLAPNFKGGSGSKPPRRILSKVTADAMRNVLADVMVHGTAIQSQGKIYKLAGKTGTAWSSDYPKEKSAMIGSFAGFGPAENPRVLVYVGVQDPTVKPMTGSRAARVFRQIAEEVLQVMHVPPAEAATK